MNVRGELFVGSLLLTAALLCHSVVLLVFEPAMGFREFSDFFELQKILPALGSVAWSVGSSMHILVGIGLVLIAAGVRNSNADRHILIGSFALVAAPLFVIVGMSGFVGEQLLFLLTDNSEKEATILALMVGTRTTILYSAATMFGGMVLATSASTDFVPMWLRILGVPIGISALLFAFVPLPMPLILFVWSLGLFLCKMKGT